jgi:putative ABC transport system permease protein
VNFATVAVKNVGRNAFRASLTILGVAVAMLAFVLLRTVLWAWSAGEEYAAQDRVATRHKVTFVMSLPVRYVEDIRRLPEVKYASHFNWFGARLPDHEDDFFANIATDPETFFKVYDEIEVPEAQKQAWLQDRKGALVGAQLARKYGWKPGDKVTLQGTIYPGTWEFTVDGIYNTTRKSIDLSTFWFNWKYLNESPQLAQNARDQIGWVVTRVPSARDAPIVARKIDQMFDSRDIQTLSMSERAMNASFLGMFSALLKAMDIVSLVILVIMMLILGNTIAMTVRERTHEYGVLRAIGFRPHHIAGLVLGEAGTIGLLGGALGVLISYPVVNDGIGRFLEDNMSNFFPYFRLDQTVAMIALVAAVACAAVAAGIPAYRASKLDVIDALRRVG